MKILDYDFPERLRLQDQRSHDDEFEVGCNVHREQIDVI